MFRLCEHLGAMDDSSAVSNYFAPPVQAVASPVEVSPSQLGRCGVYCFIHRETGKCYVGSSKDIRGRKKSHLASSKKGGTSCFHNALRRFGPDAFDFEILEFCEEDVRFEREYLWIVFLNSASANGFNTFKKPCEIFTHSVPEATRLRMSARMIGNKYGCGKVVTLEERARISARNKGNKNCLGRVVTKEANEKRRLAMQGKKYALGCVRSVETLAKMSIAMKGKNVGKKRSVDTILKRNHTRREKMIEKAKREGKWMFL